jgi:hypothetical protein
LKEDEKIVEIIPDCNSIFRCLGYQTKKDEEEYENVKKVVAD